MSRFGHLWLVYPDELGREIGSVRVAVEIRDGVLRNLTSASFLVTTPATTHVAYLSRNRGSPAILQMPTSAGRSLKAGDTLLYDVGALEVILGNVMTPELILPNAAPKEETFEQFMEQYPGATHREVWDAAYAAGGQLVHTLLTGECE